MKVLLLIFTLFTGQFLLAQDTVISITSRQWAGGICCSYGNDMTVYFSTKQLPHNIDSMQLSVQGMVFHVKENSFSTNRETCTLSFGWRSNKYSDLDEMSTSYYGINQNQISTVTDLTNKAIVFYSDGTKQEIQVKYTEDYIAYP